MEIVVYTLAGLSLVLAVYFIAAWMRVGKTLNFLMGALDEVSVRSQEDISNGNYDWQWRYEVYEAGSERAWSNRFLLTFRPLTNKSVFGSDLPFDVDKHPVV